jgi:hypothetical protein
MARSTSCYLSAGKAPMHLKNRRATMQTALITSNKFRRLVYKRLSFGRFKVPRACAFS